MTKEEESELIALTRKAIERYEEVRSWSPYKYGKLWMEAEGDKILFDQIVDREIQKRKEGKL